MRTIIVDDEPLARQRVKNLISDIPELTLLSECATGKKAIEEIQTLNPDLVFLDIQLKDMTGFDVLKKIQIEIHPIIIFVTAYDEYAIKAFEFFAFDYLQKPFKDERFYKSVKRFIENYQLKQHATVDHKIDNLLNYINNTKTPKINVNKFPIKSGNKIIFIDQKDIKYITASGYYAEVFSGNNKHLIRESLSNLISELNTSIFFRIHRSTIINLNCIKEIINSNYGETDVKMNDDSIFRISRNSKKAFLNKMGV